MSVNIFLFFCQHRIHSMGGWRGISGLTIKEGLASLRKPELQTSLWGALLDGLRATPKCVGPLDNESWALSMSFPNLSEVKWIRILKDGNIVEENESTAHIVIREFFVLCFRNEWIDFSWKLLESHEMFCKMGPGLEKFLGANRYGWRGTRCSTSEPLKRAIFVLFKTFPCIPCFFKTHFNAFFQF